MVLKEEFIDNLHEIIESNFHHEDFNVKTLAQKLNISRSQLHRNIINFIGVSAGSYINELRLKKAFIMLQEGRCNVSEIAYKVGFSSPSYFSTAFKKKYAYSPTKVQVTGVASLSFEDRGAKNTEGFPDLRSNENTTPYSVRRLKKMGFTSIVAVLLLILIFNIVSRVNKNSTNHPSLFDRSIAVLPLKKKLPTSITVPAAGARISVPVGAAMSSPLCGFLA